MTAHSITNNINVRAVSFYQGSQLVATLTNAPYQLVIGFGSTGETHEFRASVIDQDGQTNVSHPIRLTVDPARLFNPFRLPSGEVVFFYSMDERPNCVSIWNGELGKGWEDAPGGLIKGMSTVIIEERMTHAPARFYRIRRCM